MTEIGKSGLETRISFWMETLLSFCFFLTVLRRSLALAAGSVGIVCWLSAFLDVTYFKTTSKPSQYSILIQYGSGIFLGIVGVAIILISFFLKPQKQECTPVPPPPNPNLPARAPSMRISS